MNEIIPYSDIDIHFQKVNIFYANCQAIVASIGIKYEFGEILKYI